MNGRGSIRGFNGISLPPRKNRSLDKKNCITMRFVLTGAIPSKKNSQRAAMNWYKIIKEFNRLSAAGTFTVSSVIKTLKANKPFIRPGDGVLDWKKNAIEKIHEQCKIWSASYEKRGLIFPVTKSSIAIYHYWKDNKVRDNSNKSETIHDLLRDAGVISGDSWQELSPIKSDADLYRDELTDHITVIDLTAYSW